MKFLGYVQAEGGPLLLGDAQILKHWTGTDGTDYKKCCEMFDDMANPDAISVGVGSGTAVAWEMRGAGTAFVFSAEKEGVCIVRMWPKKDIEIEKVAMDSCQYEGEERFKAQLTISSGSMAILWAPESGSAIQSADIACKRLRPTGELSLGDSAILVVMEPGDCECVADDFENDQGLFRRVWIRST